MIIESGETGECPHCGIVNRFERATTNGGSLFREAILEQGKDNSYSKLGVGRCTSCAKNVIFWEHQMVYPLGSSRSQCPKEVPQDIAKDYSEACLVENLSPKATAALTRTCLQNMLRKQGITPGDLSDEIEEAMKSLPSHLSEAIDAIRNIGNFASHPIKSKNTGSILDVERGEAEWNLDVLEQLFDFYYVQPEKTRLKKSALNAKLNEAGKPD